MKVQEPNSAADAREAPAGTPTAGHARPAKATGMRIARPATVAAISRRGGTDEKRFDGGRFRRRADRVRLRVGELVMAGFSKTPGVSLLLAIIFFAIAMACDD